MLGTAQPPRPAALQYRQALPGMPGLLPGAGHAQFAAQFHAMGHGGITQLVQPHQRYVLPAGLAAAGVPGGYMPPGQPGAAAASAAASAAAAAALGAELDRKRKLEAMQAASGMSAATALQQQQAAAGPPLKREQLAGPGPAGHIPQQVRTGKGRGCRPPGAGCVVSTLGGALGAGKGVRPPLPPGYAATWGIGLGATTGCTARRVLLALLLVCSGQEGWPVSAAMLVEQLLATRLSGCAHAGRPGGRRGGGGRGHRGGGAG